MTDEYREFRRILRERAPEAAEMFMARLLTEGPALPWRDLNAAIRLMAEYAFGKPIPAEVGEMELPHSIGTMPRGDQIALLVDRMQKYQRALMALEAEEQRGLH